MLEKLLLHGCGIRVECRADLLAYTQSNASARRNRNTECDRARNG